MEMPIPNAEVIERREAIAADLLSILGPEGVIDDKNAMSPFESDGLNAYRQSPLVGRSWDVFDKS